MGDVYLTLIRLLSAERITLRAFKCAVTSSEEDCGGRLTNRRQLCVRPVDLAALQTGDEDWRMTDCLGVESPIGS